MRHAGKKLRVNTLMAGAGYVRAMLRM